MKSKTNISIVSNTGVRRKSEVIIGDSGTYTSGDILDANATHSEINTKQDALISGQNIKTINNVSLLGSGNIDIQGGGSSAMSLQVIDLNSVHDPDEDTFTFKVAANTIYVLIYSNAEELRSADLISVELPSTIDDDTANICIIINNVPFVYGQLDFYSEFGEVGIVYDSNSGGLSLNYTYKCDLLGVKVHVGGEDHIVWYVQKTTLSGTAA